MASEGIGSVLAGSTEARKISKSGYDVTPLTEEERQAAAANLTDFQR